MRDWVGIAVSVLAGLAILVALAWPYAVQSDYAIGLYYGSGVVNPLLVGAFAIGVIVAFAADRVGAVSPAAGGGIVLGLALGAFVVAAGWALTARVDLFEAPGWLLPAHRFVLVGLSGFALVGAGWYARTAGLSVRGT